MASADVTGPPPSAPAAVPMQGHEALLAVLLRNLLDNALRHSAASSQPPVLRVRAQDGRVAFTVRDHGEGVGDEALAQLGEPFYRPDSSRERTKGGVGLGLYLCRLVAQAHGGTFGVRNAEGGGLEVSVTLPADAPISAESLAALVESQKPAHTLAHVAKGQSGGFVITGLGRLGIDTLLRQPAPAVLGDGALRLGGNTIVGGAAAPGFVLGALAAAPSHPSSAGSNCE